MKRILALLLACALSASLLTGCTGKTEPSDPEPSATPAADPDASSQTDPSENSGTDGAVTGLKLTAAELPQFDSAQPQDGLEAVRTAINNFSFRLSAELLSKEDGNLICSPLSVYFTLAAVLNAAEGDKQTALLDAMGLSGVPVDEVNQGFATILGQLTAPVDDGTGENAYEPIEIANAVFVSRDYTLETQYAQDILDFLRGEAFEVDFTSSDAVAAINQWCDEHTKGLIPEIVQELDPATVAAVANAIYFSDRWDSEFDPADNVDMVFHAPGGDQTVPFMTQENYFQYYEDSDMQVVNLGFLTGGGLLILLPSEGNNAGTLLSSLDADSFSTLLGELSRRKGTVTLPKFKLDFAASLNDALSALGLDSIYNTDDPMFTRMVQENDLYVSDVFHKATIEVSETGTTAAAVTIMLMEATGVFEDTDSPFEMTCDRPFAFILYDEVGSWEPQVLFTGVMNQIAE